METNLDKQFIAKEYKEFVDLAHELAEKEFPTSTLHMLSKKEDAFSKHLCRMLEMYAIRFGDMDERLKILEYLEKRLIPWDELSTNEIWDDIKKQILSGEYKDLNENGK
ncbi:MAG: hypothetical protein WC389_17330 [Lutibacter sp.]|jgi:hypothetical protein